jgi:outer membrane immunogenic protein
MSKVHALVSAAALLGTAVAAPAFAQDSRRDTHFDGPYISGTFGMGAQQKDIGETVVFDANRDGRFNDTVTTAAGANAFSPGFCSGGSAGNSVQGGCFGDENHEEYSGRIGWDARVLGGNFVAGALVEVSKSQSRDFVTAFSSTPARYTLGREMDVAVSLRGRLGYTPGGGALFYVTGGPAYGKIDHTFSTSNTQNAFTEIDSGKWVLGGQVGGGAEVMLTDNISLGVEYLFNSFRDNKYRVRVTQGTAPASNPFLLQGGSTDMRFSNVNFDYHSLRGTLSYQF